MRKLRRLPWRVPPKLRAQEKDMGLHYEEVGKAHQAAQKEEENAEEKKRNPEGIPEATAP